MATLLVTVGSTSFPALTDFLTSESAQEELHRIGIHHAVIQYGTRKPSAPALTTSTSVTNARRMPKMLIFDYTQTLDSYLDSASVVVSHAGAGTILETIDRGKPLVVVINSALMDDHQTELARAMAQRGCCRVVRHADITTQLLPAIHTAISDPQALRANPPPRAPGVFATVVGQELVAARESTESSSLESEVVERLN